MRNDLQGKVALVTGGNSGIGLATAKAFAEEGAKVIISGRNQEKIDNAVKEIGHEALGIQADVSNLNDLDKMYSEIKKYHESIDILFANAGVAEFVPVNDVTEEHFDRLVNINIKGTFFTVQKALPLLKEGSSVILNTSVVSSIGFATSSVYSITKAAVRSMARTLSSDLLERKIRVNAIAPGPIDTPIFETLGVPADQLDATKASFAEFVPLKRVGTPNEIAKTVLFLGSDDSSYILGEEIIVGGGMGRL